MGQGFAQRAFAPQHQLVAFQHAHGRGHVVAAQLQTAGRHRDLRQQSACLGGCTGCIRGGLRMTSALPACQQHHHSQRCCCTGSREKHIRKNLHGEKENFAAHTAAAPVERGGSTAAQRTRSTPRKPAAFMTKKGTSACLASASSYQFRSFRSEPAAVRGPGTAGATQRAGAAWAGRPATRWQALRGRVCMVQTPAPRG